MPLVPGGESGSFASTRCTMFPVGSCSPPVMKILAPDLIRAIASRAPRVLISPRSVPQWGSVRHIVPDHSPAGHFRQISVS